MKVDGVKENTATFSVVPTKNSAVTGPLKVSVTAKIDGTSNPANYLQVGAIPLDDGVTEQVVVRVLPAIAPGNAGRFVRLRVSAP